jgi:protein tyrosine phosphatase (PTP) superfamily phosphohydrolase (DUF442 family)
MQIEVTVSQAAAAATYGLLFEYIKQGGTGHDEDAIMEFMDALAEADRIVISGE